MIIRVMMLGIVLLAGCAQSAPAPPAPKGPEPEADNHRLLRQQGYKDIVLKGYVPFKCGDDDSMFFTDGFEATAPNGDKVTGTICGAFTKGKTIRLN